LSRWGNRYTALMLGVPVRDCTSGFRAYKPELISSGIISSTTSNGYAFLSEVLMRLYRQRDRVILEIPIVYAERVSGVSKMDKSIIKESMVLVTKWGLRRFL